MNDGAIKKPVVIIGGGGHASVLVDILKQQKRDILAIISPDDTSRRKIFDGVEVLKNDADILKFSSENILLVNGIGALPGTNAKLKVNILFKEMGYHFETVISDASYVSPYAILDEGVQIFPGAVVQAGAYIRKHTVINTRAVIEHDVDLGEYNFISPGAVICGQCITGANVFVGANATVIQNLKLGENTIVNAGTLVFKDTLSGQKVSTQRSVIR